MSSLLYVWISIISIECRRVEKSKSIVKISKDSAKPWFGQKEDKPVIAVVGAGGATGLETVKALLAQGKQVRCVVRNPEKYSGKFGTAEVAKGDVTDEESLKEAFNGCHGVVFAASASTYMGPGGPHEVDYMGLLKTVNAAKEAGVKRLVVVSSRLVNPINKWHPVRILLNNIRYSLMDYKFEGEEFVRKSGLEYVIVRPGGLMGGEGQRPAKSEPGSEHILAAEAEGDLGSARSIHRGDVAAVVCEALFSDDAKNKTIEIVARPREEEDPRFEQRLTTMFDDI